MIQNPDELLLYKPGWLLGSFCSLLCRKESLENKKNNKPEVNQIANSDNKVYVTFSALFSNNSVDLTINVSPLYRDSVVCAILE